MSRRSLNPAALLWAAWCGYAAVAHADSSDRYKPIHLEADRVSIDDMRQVSTFTGNVLLTQGTMSINGEQIVVTQNKQGLERGTATGQPAGFRQRREGSEEFVEGYGERIEYDVVADVVNIYGQAHIKRGQDEVRGEHIVYNPRTEVFQVSGALAVSPNRERVRVVIQPRTNNAASAAPAAEPLSIKPDTALPPPEGKP
jgi:lipopolysaccharide export system protein LptA